MMRVNFQEVLEAADAYANAFIANGSSTYNPKTAEARKALEEKMRAISPPEQQATQGMVLVPVEPTREMLEAGRKAVWIKVDDPGEFNLTSDEAKNVFAAMLDASPAAPGDEKEEQPSVERAELVERLKFIASDVLTSKLWRGAVSQAAALLSADAKVGAEPDATVIESRRPFAPVGKFEKSAVLHNTALPAGTKLYTRPPAAQKPLSKDKAEFLAALYDGRQVGKEWIFPSLEELCNFANACITHGITCKEQQDEH